MPSRNDFHLTTGRSGNVGLFGSGSRGCSRLPGVRSCRRNGLGWKRRSYPDHSFGGRLGYVGAVFPYVIHRLRRREFLFPYETADTIRLTGSPTPFDLIRNLVWPYGWLRGRGGFLPYPGGRTDHGERKHKQERPRPLPPGWRGRVFVIRLPEAIGQPRPAFRGWVGGWRAPVLLAKKPVEIIHSGTRF
jgi:hypothetical protein